MTEDTPLEPSPPNLLQLDIKPRRITAWILTAVLVLIAIFLIIKGLQGFYRIQPGEAAAIQTFGAARPEPQTQGGLHWHYPSPIGKVTIEQVEKNRTAEVGFITLPDETIDILTGENWMRDFDAATMISGDLNLLETQIVAHYHISDINAYLFYADDPGVSFNYQDGDKERRHQSHPAGRPDGQTIKDAIEIAIRRSVGQRTIDAALVDQREVIERETMIHAQQLLDQYRTGLRITSVQLQEVKPPDEVQTAFDDVLQAREERDKRINEALAFESKTLPEARGAAERIRKEAETYRAERINQAEGEAARFLNILEEYLSAPDIIAERMYLETMDRILPGTRQTLIVGAEAGPIIINQDSSRATVIPGP